MVGRRKSAALVDLCCREPMRTMAAFICVSVSLAKYVTHDLSASSSALPLGMRSPPVCGMRIVGLLSRSDCATFVRSTKADNFKPKISMASVLASDEGNLSRVADDTPLSLWHMRHSAFSRMG